MTRYIQYNWKTGKKDRFGYDEYTSYAMEFTNSFAHFLTNSPGVPDRIRSLFTSLFDDYNATENGGRVIVKTTGEPTINYFHIRKGDEPVVSYLPAGKEQGRNDSGAYTRAGRQTMKPGKWLRSIVNAATLIRYGVTDHVIEVFSNHVKEYCDDTTIFEEVQGADIAKYYDETSYAVQGQGMGSLGNSCMRYGERKLPKGTFDIYTRNANCSLLVAFDKRHMVVGRALLWRNVDIRYCGLNETLTVKNAKIETVTYLDRVYSTYDYLDQMFFDYAKDKGWWRRSRNDSYSEHGTLDPKGHGHKAELVVSTTFGYGNRPHAFPYCDTFTHMAREFDRMANLPVEQFDGFYTMQSQHGAISQLTDLRGQVMTDLSGRIHESQVGTCPLCRRTGARSSFHVVQGQTSRVCLECVTTHYQRSHLMNCFIPTAEAIRIHTFQGGTDYVTRQAAVTSKVYGYKIARQGSIYLPYYKDWVYADEPLTKCKRLGGVSLMRSHATYFREINDWVPTDKYEEIKAIVKEEQPDLFVAPAPGSRYSPFANSAWSGSVLTDNAGTYKVVPDNRGGYTLEFTPGSVAATNSSVVYTTGNITLTSGG